MSEREQIALNGRRTIWNQHEFANGRRRMLLHISLMNQDQSDKTRKSMIDALAEFGFPTTIETLKKDLTWFRERGLELRGEGSGVRHDGHNGIREEERFRGDVADGWAALNEFKSSKSPEELTTITDETYREIIRAAK